MDVWDCETVGLWNQDTLICSASFVIWMCSIVGHVGLVELYTL